MDISSLVNNLKDEYTIHQNEYSKILNHYINVLVLVFVLCFILIIFTNIRHFTSWTSLFYKEIIIIDIYLLLMSWFFLHLYWSHTRDKFNRKRNELSKIGNYLSCLDYYICYDVSHGQFKSLCIKSKKTFNDSFKRVYISKDDFVEYDETFNIKTNFKDIKEVWWYR